MYPELWYLLLYRQPAGTSCLLISSTIPHPSVSGYFVSSCTVPQFVVCILYPDTLHCPPAGSRLSPASAAQISIIRLGNSLSLFLSSLWLRRD
jgi:hypothetical protein